MAPGYVGKTFYMWPPDPCAPVGQIGDTGYAAGDWRRASSSRAGSTQDTRDNSIFWSVNGRWKRQNHGSSANYIVNYDQIPKWLKRGPQTLPDSLLRPGALLRCDSRYDSDRPVERLHLRYSPADQALLKDYITTRSAAGRYSDAAECMNGREFHEH